MLRKFVTVMFIFVMITSSALFLTGCSQGTDQAASTTADTEQEDDSMDMDEQEDSMDMDEQEDDMDMDEHGGVEHDPNAYGDIKHHALLGKVDVAYYEGATQGEIEVDEIDIVEVNYSTDDSKDDVLTDTREMFEHSKAGQVEETVEDGKTYLRAVAVDEDGVEFNLIAAISSEGGQTHIWYSVADQARQSAENE